MLPKKPKTRYTQAMGLIAFAVGLYALVNHLSVIGSVFHFLTDLLQPLIVGAILAFFLNVPMRGLERLFFRFQTKRRWKVRERANEVFSLIITYVGGFLLIFLGPKLHTKPYLYLYFIIRRWFELFLEYGSEKEKRKLLKKRLDIAEERRKVLKYYR